ncbi:uncharacterized protein LOC142924618 isoform X4 [Petromyzon marinus]|uniref:uncharacterized protein LOC142924618 isoform X4 n=1 Tax=Petromyzon marinus TaxID=7757 RepID=UPI003F727AD2
MTARPGLHVARNPRTRLGVRSCDDIVGAADEDRGAFGVSLKTWLGAAHRGLQKQRQVARGIDGDFQPLNPDGMHGERNYCGGGGGG